MKPSDIPSNANPLDMDLSGLDVRRPLLAGNLPYDLLVKKCEIQKYGATTAHPNDEFVYIELTNTAPAQSPTGDPCFPNSVTVFDRINTRPYGKATMAMVSEQLAKFQQALRATGMPLRQALATAAGKVVQANITVEPAGSRNGKTYPEKNAVGYYILPKS